MFRLFQTSATGLILLTWLIRSSHHVGWHPMLLVTAAFLFAATEVSYRLGKAESAPVGQEETRKV